MSTQKKPPSEAKLRANRANALKSTGPRTPEGKRRSARNALTHGLTARDITALGEAYEALPSTVEQFTESWRPRNPYEHSLVVMLATLTLRLSRCARMETGLFDMSIPVINPTDGTEVVNAAIAASFTYHEKSFTALSRYEANLSRAYERTFKALIAAQKHDPPAEEEIDETNPISDENKGPQLVVEPTPPRRLELEPAPEPAESTHRRSGRQINLHRPKPQPVELIWISDEDEPETPPQPPTDPPKAA